MRKGSSMFLPFSSLINKVQERQPFFEFRLLPFNYIEMKDISPTTETFHC
jgi:hypothetical protein